MRYLELLVENTPRTLYHGTLKEFLPSIMSRGLRPEVGSFVKWAYADYEEAGEELDDLVFAADKQGLQRCVNAVFHRLEVAGHEATAESFYRFGAIVVMVEGEGDFEHHDDDDGYKDYPVQVEPDDYFRYSSIRPDYALTDKRLRNFLRRNGIIVNYRGAFDRTGAEAEVLRRELTQTPNGHGLRTKIASLSDDELKKRLGLW